MNGNYDQIFTSLIDINSGEYLQNTKQQWNYSLVGACMSSALIGDWYLLMCGINRQHPPAYIPRAEAQAGIYVLNRIDLTVHSCIHGKFQCMSGASNDECIVAIGNDDTVNGFRMDNGTLARIRSFSPQPGVSYGQTEKVLVTVSGTLLFTVLRGFT